MSVCHPGLPLVNTITVSVEVSYHLEALDALLSDPYVQIRL